MNTAKKCNRLRIFYAATAALVLILSFSEAARAAIVYSKNLEEVPGLRFENFVYSWNKIDLNVVNTTSYNRVFEGTMIFLDRRGKPLAKASLLPKKIRPMSSERHIAYFIEGSGEMAQQAAKVIWDFGAK